MNDTIQAAKIQCAQAAIKSISSSNILGIGSGSTVALFVEALASALQSGKLENIVCIPASYQSEHDLRKAKIPISSLMEHPSLDFTIDGADEIDPKYNLIKGGGAALTREKIIAQAAQKVLILADYQKQVTKLGSKFPVPVEIIPFSFGFIQTQLNDLGGTSALRIANKKNGPVISDNGNFILDVNFQDLSDPSAVGLKINNIPGVVEHGLFCALTDEVIIGYPDRVEHIIVNK